MTESPQQHEPDQEMASSTNTNSVLIPDLVPKQDVPEQPVPKLSIPEQIIIDQSSATNTILEPEITIDDQPSSSNLALQTSAPARPKNIPSPPTIFLDSIFHTPNFDQVLSFNHRFVCFLNSFHSPSIPFLFAFFIRILAILYTLVAFIL